MSDGKLIIEIYEYAEDSAMVPPFEYIPCALSACIKHNNKATLKEIIENGFNSLPKRSQDTDKRRDILQRIDEADIGRISVAYHPARGGTDPYVELTNVVPVSISHADARLIRDNSNNIILHGKYRMSEGNETTILKDAQRLTLVYTNCPAEQERFGEVDDTEEETQKEISLNITYFQD